MTVKDHIYVMNLLQRSYNAGSRSSYNRQKRPSKMQKMQIIGTTIHRMVWRELGS